MNLIQLNNVTKDFYDGDKTIHVLKDTSLKIDSQQFTAIIGPSGSGKSTLLTILGALQKPTSGQVLMSGKDISELKQKELSQLRFESIGFILQAANLVPYLTIKEQFELKSNYQKSKKEEQRIQDILAQLSIEHIQNKYPEDISGGERQRAAIGAALMLKPKIILADEPTASLDTEKALEVVQVLQDISKKENTAIVMVTHDTRMLKYCDRVIEIQDGLIKEKR